MDRKISELEKAELTERNREFINQIKGSDRKSRRKFEAEMKRRLKKIKKREKLNVKKDFV